MMIQKAQWINLLHENMLSESRPQNDDEKSSATTAKRFYSGLIPDPDATNSPEELARLEEIYNSIDKSLTDNKDANAKSAQWKLLNGEMHTV